MDEVPASAPDPAGSILHPSASPEQVLGACPAGVRLPGSLVWILPPRPPRPERPVVLPYRLYGDPERGQQLLAGRDPFGTLTAPLDGNFWSQVATQPETDHRVHGLGWLEDLLAVRTGQAVRLGQDITAAWLDIHSSGHTNGTGHAWHLSLIARRLITWVRTGSLLTFDASEPFLADLTRAIAHHAALLARWQWLAGTGETRIEIETALGLAGVTLARPHPLVPRVQNRLARHLQQWCKTAARQGDGDPQAFLRMAFCLSLILESCRQIHQEITPVTRATGEALASHLASLALTGRDLCRLGTGGMTPAGLLPGTLAALGAVAPTRALPRKASCVHLAASGVHAVLNTRGPRHGTGTLHPSSLSIECADGDDILLADAGVGRGFGGGVAAWTTAGHGCSTLHLAETPFPTGLTAGSPAVGMVGTIERSSKETARDLQVTASRSISPGSGPASCTRTLTLARDGARIAGLDILALDAGRHPDPIHIRLTFNLHPMVAILDDGSAGSPIQLRLPSGARWQFALNDGPSPILADSLFIDDLRHEIWKTSRILILDTPTTHQVRYAWCLERLPA